MRLAECIEGVQWSGVIAGQLTIYNVQLTMEDNYSVNKHYPPIKERNGADEGMKLMAKALSNEKNVKSYWTC